MFGSPDVNSNITSSIPITNKRCNFGRAVAASKDGRIVAVSEKSWNGAAADENGYVEVYQYSTDTLSWSQLGTTIYANIGNAEEEIGGSVSGNEYFNTKRNWFFIRY